MLSHPTPLLKLAHVFCGSISAQSFTWHLLRAGLSSSSSCCSASANLAMVRELRERSGAPISDVKASLEASGWDLAKAYDVLRQRGLAAAAKKASRNATEGLVGLAAGPCSAAIVEINSETDFVARNELFHTLVQDIAQATLQIPAAPAADRRHEVDIQQVGELQLASGQSVAGAVTAVAAQVRENIKLRRAFRFDTSGVIGGYVHSSVGPGLGRIASLVAIEREDCKPMSEDMRTACISTARDLAMHVVGLKPQFLDRSQVPHQVLEHERAIFAAHASSSGKPAAVINRMVEGRLVKFYEETCLSEQGFVLDGSIRVKKVLEQLSKEVGQPLQISAFSRVQCGEGLETNKTDFATEVASMAGKA